ncbi:MAG: hypothetical protein ACOYOH_12620 [Paracraurococcus sp.]
MNAPGALFGLLFTPGIDLRGGTWRLFTDIGFLVRRSVRGSQPVAPALYRAPWVKPI